MRLHKVIWRMRTGHEENLADFRPVPIGLVLLPG